jgi:RimJ/RimL family protein N-acetyltransferase
LTDITSKNQFRKVEVFKDLKKHRIIVSIDPGNLNSIRLVERIGFRKEAHFVESLWINGNWVDDLIYAMIEKDWEN